MGSEENGSAMRVSRSHTSHGTTTGGGSQTRNPGPAPFAHVGVERLWIARAGLVASVMVWRAWLNRNHWYAMLAPYGLTSEETHTGYSGFDIVTAYGKGGFAIK
jgi:hypothetical protein